MSLGTNLPGNFSHFQETGFRAQIQWFVMCETLWQFSLGEDVLTLFVLHQHHSIISHVFAFILAIQQTSKRDVFSIINMNKCDAHLLGALSTHFHSAILPVALLQSLWMPSVFLWFQVMFSQLNSKYPCGQISLVLQKAALTPSNQWRLSAAANTRLQADNTVWMSESLLWLQL